MDANETFEVNPSGGVDAFIREMVGWMNKQMKAYGKLNLEEIVKDKEKTKTLEVDIEQL